MSRELAFVLSKTQKVTLHVQTFLSHWGLKRRVGAGLMLLPPLLLGGTLLLLSYTLYL